MQTSPLILTAIAGLSTGLGGVLAVLGKPTEKLLAASAGFAGGVMLTASLTDLLPEALHFYGRYLPPLACGGALATLTALGMAAAGLLGKLLPEESELAARFGQGRDPARAAAMRTALITGAALLLHNFPEGVLTFFAGTADPALGLRTAAAIALHNIPEGLAVGVAFGALKNGGYTPEALMGAVTVAVGIGLQNFPEGAAVSLPLRREGCSRRKSFFIGQASGFVEPIAGVLGALLAVYIEAVLPFALSFAAGAMILVAVHELIPECQRNQEAQPYAATMGIVTGFALMMLLDVMLG